MNPDAGRKFQVMNPFRQSCFLSDEQAIVCPGMGAGRERTQIADTWKG